MELPFRIPAKNLLFRVSEPVTTMTSWREIAGFRRNLENPQHLPHITAVEERSKRRLQCQGIKGVSAGDEAAFLGQEADQSAIAASYNSHHSRWNGCIQRSFREAGLLPFDANRGATPYREPRVA